MADAYRGLTIQIGGDTTKLSAALRAAKKAASETQAQLRLVSKAARFDPENVTLAANKLKLMGNVAEDLGAKLKNLERGLETMEGKKFLSGTVKTVKELASETENASLAAKQAHERYNDVNAMLERMNATLNKQAQATGKVSESFDIRGMGAENAISTLRSIGAITDDQITKFRHLKTAWRDAFNDKMAKDAVVTLQKMGNDAEATRAELKKLGVDMAALDAPSDIAKSLSSVDDQLAKADANAKYLASDLEKCEAALRLDPSNMDAARRKMTDLGAAADIANEKAGLLKKKLDAYRSAGIDAAASDMARLAEEADKANTEYAQSLTALKTMEGRLEQLRAEYTRLGDNPDEMADTFTKAAAEIQECVSKVDQLKVAEREAASARETANAKKEYAELAQEMQQAESQARQLASSMESVSAPSNWTHMKTMGMTLSAVLTPAMERFGSYALQSATDIDTAYRNMRKTVQGSEGDFQKLKQSALEFSSVNFASAEQILSIQAIGGELGVATESLDTFATTASNLDIATDLDAETAATALGQLDNILGDLNESTMPNFADSLVRLGNNGASTESQILDIATRIGSMASIVGMATPDMLALSSTIASTGQNSEAAGTAISKTMSFMETAVASGGSVLSEIAATAQMSADQFAAAWEKRPLEAIMAFIKGLNQLEENGGSADLRLQELGITAVRQKQAIEGLMQTVKSQNGELSTMEANAQMASNAWNGLSDQWGAAGDAAREAEAKNEGFAGSVQRIKNIAQNAASEIADSLAPAMDDIADAAADLYEDFSQASDGTKRFVAAAGVLAAGLGPGLSVIATMGTGLSDLYKKMKKGGEAFSKLTKGADAARLVLGPLASEADVAALATEGLTLKMKAANVGAGLMKTGLLGLKVAAVTLAVAGIGVLVSKQMELERHQKLVNEALTSAESIVEGAGASYESSAGGIDTMRHAAEETLRSLKELNDQLKTDMDEMAANEGTLDSYVDTIEELGNKGNLTAYEQEKLKLAVEGYNSITGDSVGITDAQTGALTRNTDEIRRNAEAWKEKARAEAYAEYAKEYAKEQADAEMKLAEAKEQLAQAQKDYNKAVTDLNNANTSGDKGAAVEAAGRVEQLAEKITNLKQNISETEGAFESAGDGVDYFTNKAAIAAAALDTRLKEPLESLPTELQPIGLNIAMALQKGIDEGSISVTDAIGRLKQLSNVSLSTLPEELRPYAEQAMDAISAAITDGTVDVDTAIKLMTEVAKTPPSELPALFKEYGIEMPEEMAAAIEEHVGSVLSASGTVRDSALSPLSGLAAQAYSLGVDLVNGYASGLGDNAALNAVAMGAAAMAKTALNSIKAAQNSNSPSKESAKLGVDFGDGYALGITDTSDEAGDAGDELARIALMALDTTSQGSWTSGYHAATNFADGLYSGVGAVSGAAGALGSAADAAFQAYVDQMIAGYKERGDEFAEVSTEIAEAIWGTIAPSIDAVEYIKPFTGEVYDSMKVLEGAGLTLDQYSDKLEDMAEKKAEWDKKAAGGLSDSEKESYEEFLKEYDSFMQLNSKMTASMESMREWQGLYKMKDTIISTTGASEELTQALYEAGATGATFSQEFLDYIADGGDDAVKALKQLTAMGPDALQEMSDSFRDMAIAEREAELAGRELYVNSLAYTDFKTPKEQLLDYRETVLDVREAMYSDEGLSNAFKMTGTSAEGFAADLMSVGMSMEDFKSQYADFTGAVTNGFSQMTKYNQTSLADWEQNLKLNMAEAQKWSENLQEVFSKVPESIDSEAFRKAILEGGFDQWGKVIDEMAGQSSEAIQSYIELYNESIKEAQMSGMEAFKALAPGEEMVQAMIEGMQGQQEALNGTMAEAAAGSTEALAATGPQFYSTGQGLAGQIAAGIQSQIDSIAAAAAATVSAALAAAQAEASKAQGIADSIKSSYSAAAQRAASPMMMAAQAAAPASVRNTSVSMSFTVNTQPGQSLDVRQLAKQVVKIQDREMRARGIR